MQGQVGRRFGRNPRSPDAVQRAAKRNGAPPIRGLHKLGGQPRRVCGDPGPGRPSPVCVRQDTRAKNALSRVWESGSRPLLFPFRSGCIQAGNWREAAAPRVRAAARAVGVFMSIRDQKRRGALGQLGAALALSALTAVMWFAQSAPASACNTSPCGPLLNDTPGSMTCFNISGPGGGHSSITTQPSIRTDDPYFSYLSILDSGSQVTSASGGYNGKTGTSHTNDYDGGELAVYNGWDKTIGLSANQSLVAGVTVDFDLSQTTFQNTGLAPGFAAGPATVGSTSQTTYGVTGSLDYFVGTAYFGTNLAGYWGNGRLTETFAGGASGSYGVHGDAVSFIAGNVFTLFDSRPAASRTALPGKAPPKPASGGYAIQLDVRGFVGHVEDTADGFTDTGGFTWGAERVAFWDAGAQARLFATIPDGRLTWTPYVEANVAQLFSYQDVLNLPSQPLDPGGDRLSYSEGKTFVGSRIGLYAQDAGGIGVGVSGIYDESSQVQALGGLVYARYVFPK